MLFQSHVDNAEVLTVSSLWVYDENNKRRQDDYKTYLYSTRCSFAPDNHLSFGLCAFSNSK